MTVNLTGEKFGRLIVITKSDKRSGGHVMWKCLCECGTEKDVRGTHLTLGKVSSCGCYANEMLSKRAKSHGLSKDRVYRIWRNMINRCHYPNYHEKQYYADRGIKVCDRWRYSFDNFLADMGIPDDDLSIDRINNDGDYEPGNCRWATASQQNSNKRRRNLHSLDVTRQNVA